MSTNDGMVLLAGGTFLMGSEKFYPEEAPVREVSVGAFRIDAHTVTNRDFSRFVRKTGYVTVAERPLDPAEFPGADPKDLVPGAMVFRKTQGPLADLNNWRQWWDYVGGTYWRRPEGPGSSIESRPDHPVVHVAYEDAEAYARWLGKRLPTEAEWEFAARGRQEALFPWGDVMPEWIPNGGRGPLQAPWPVTLGEPTDFGLLGIATNVHEWCADWHDKDYYSRSPERNPAGPDQGVRRAARGGAWRHAHTICRVTLRGKLDPTFRYNDFGFRLARSL
jgi:formylglycine-generating enzyme required for sulfatase activity